MFAMTSYLYYNCVNNNNNTLRDYNQLNKTNYSCTTLSSSNYINFTDKLMKNAELIRSFGELSDNWNGYDAEKISKDVIMSAITAVYLIEIQPDVFPTGRNSIQFEYEKKNGDYLEFEIYSNHITMLKIIGDTEFEENVASTDLNKLVENFYAGI